MIFIDTDEKFNWLLEAFESDCFQVESREWTQEEEEELSMEIARRKALRKEAKAKEAVLA
jgi:hypothetical protein